MSDEEWGPWIEHDGSGCPVPVGTIVKLELEGFVKNGRWNFQEGTKVLHTSIDKAIVIRAAANNHSWNWDNYGKLTTRNTRVSKVLRYQVKKPKGLVILEKLLQELPTPTPTKELTKV